MTTDWKRYLSLSGQINELAQDITTWRKVKGFRTPDSIKDREHTLAKLMLIVSEIGEAAEAVRDENYENFDEEICDTLIRILDIVGAMRIDCISGIVKKMEFNETRPQRHGRKV